jgi:hypothetical protein
MKSINSSIDQKKYGSLKWIGLLIAAAAIGANACGLRDNGASMFDPGTKLEIQNAR